MLFPLRCLLLKAETQGPYFLGVTHYSYGEGL